jgi:hypothetical protein
MMEGERGGKEGHGGSCCRWERRLKVKEEHGDGVKRSSRRGAGEGQKKSM